jgi:SSS family solute:Na+ symporter
MESGFALALLAYAAVLWAAGFGFRRGRASLDSFFLASRELGAGRVAFSLCASWIGAASLLVSTDEACRQGLGAFWIVGLPAVATLIVLTALARPIRSVSGLTPSELMRRSYGRAAGLLTTILVVWYMTVLAASQMVAAGPFLGAFLKTGPLPSLALAAAAVAVYSTAGGLRAVARTHVLQLALLLAGLGAMVAALATRTPWRAVRAAASGAGRSGYFDVLAGGGRNALIALSFVLAWTVSPIAWQRMQAARGERESRRGTAGAALILGLFYAGVVVAGMLFLPLFPGGPSGTPLVTRFISAEPAAWLSRLLFVTVLAAVFSTMDAALNAGAFTLTKDLLPGGEDGGSARSRLGLARGATALLALAAFAIAARLGDILKTLGAASAIMAEGLLVPALAALFLKRRAPLAGLLGLVCGGAYALASFLAEWGVPVLRLPPWPWSLPLGVALGAAGFAAGLAVERSKAAERPAGAAIRKRPGP